MRRGVRIREWSRLFSEYAGAQALIQLLGVLSGLWLVNLLPVREYALYTFGLSIFTFLSVFADLGVSSALLYFRREARIGHRPFAPYVRAALRLRHGLLAFGACAGLTFMAMVGRDHGFEVAEIAAMVVVLVAAAWIHVRAEVGLLQLRLEGLYRESYFAEMFGNGVRLLVVAGMWLATAPISWLAMSASAVGSLVTSIAAGRRVPRTESPGIAEAAEDLKPIERIARYVLPTSLSAAYFSIQAPLIVWVSAYFAGTESVAQVGALGRLGVIFGLFSGFIGVVFIPRLSAVTDDAIYLRRYLQCWSVLIAFGVAMIALAAAAPGWLLALLGHAYRGLSRGVVLVAISSVLAIWDGYAVGINNARGWVRHQPTALAIYAFIQFSLIGRLDVSTTMGVLYFGIWSNMAGLILQAGISAIGFLQPQWVVVRRGKSL